MEIDLYVNIAGIKMVLASGLAAELVKKQNKKDARINLVDLMMSV